MTDLASVDTNLLVYAADASDREMQPQATGWMAWLWRNGTGRLNFQVLQEYYVTVTQKLKTGMDRATARADVESLMTWDPVVIDRIAMQAAWEIQQHYNLSWWNAVIVALAGRCGCRRLLTENLQDGQHFGTVQVVNLFSINQVRKAPIAPSSNPP